MLGKLVFHFYKRKKNRLKNFKEFLFSKKSLSLKYERLAKKNFFEILSTHKHAAVSYPSVYRYHIQCMRNFTIYDHFFQQQNKLVWICS